MSGTEGVEDARGVSELLLSAIDCATRVTSRIEVDLIAVRSFAVFRAKSSPTTDCGVLAVCGAAEMAGFAETALAAVPGEEPMVSVSQTIESAIIVPDATVVVVLLMAVAKTWPPSVTVRLPMASAWPL